jgi:hypothetical protein
MLLMSHRGDPTVQRSPQRLPVDHRAGSPALTLVSRRGQSWWRGEGGSGRAGMAQGRSPRIDGDRLSVSGLLHHRSQVLDVARPKWRFPSISRIPPKCLNRAGGRTRCLIPPRVACPLPKCCGSREQRGRLYPRRLRNRVASQLMKESCPRGRLLAAHIRSASASHCPSQRRPLTPQFCPQMRIRSASSSPADG